MNIVDALRRLEINGGGHIQRGNKVDPVGVYWHNGDEWAGFLKCRATLTIADLTAIDWEYHKDGR